MTELGGQPGRRNQSRVAGLGIVEALRSLAPDRPLNAEFTKITDAVSGWAAFLYLYNLR